MSEHIFDLLGVGSREDSYTNLMVPAFRTSNKFRDNILKLLGNSDDGNWIASERLSVSIPLKDGRKKDVPDIVLYNKFQNKIIVIENKVFSGEGWHQTNRYASPEFADQIAKDLGIPSSVINYYYLSLDGSKPACNSFQQISYRDVAEAIPTNLGKSKLELLMQEFKDRVLEYYSWPAPSEEEVVLKYMKHSPRLVSWKRTFSIIANGIVHPEYSERKEIEITANQGSGYIPFCAWSPRHWKGALFKEGLSNDLSYDIHFEFQWDTRHDTLRLNLHYETNPYMTRKELKEIPDALVSKFLAERNRLHAFVKKENPQGWKISKTILRIAVCDFDNGITFGDLNKRVFGLTGTMGNLVNRYLAEVKRDSDISA